MSLCKLMRCHVKVHAINDEGGTWTATYIVYDVDSKDAVVIDPLIHIDTVSNVSNTDTLDKICNFIEQHDLKLHWILNTHVREDYMYGASELRARLDAPVAINADAAVLQNVFKGIFAMSGRPGNASQYDRLLQDDEQLIAGTLTIDVMHMPGHRPACCCYRIENAVFTGDIMFMPDIGVANCDFSEDCARKLYHSITSRLYTLPDDTRVYTGYDYPEGRSFINLTTIGVCKKANIDLPDCISEEEFVSRTGERDSKPLAPGIMFTSLLSDINAGRLS